MPSPIVFEKDRLVVAYATFRARPYSCLPYDQHEMTELYVWEVGAEDAGVYGTILNALAALAIRLRYGHIRLCSSRPQLCGILPPVWLPVGDTLR